MCFARFLKENNWLNFNQNSHTHRVVYPTGHASIGLLFYEDEIQIFIYSTLVYFLPELLPPFCSLCVLYECSVGFQQNSPNMT